MFRSLAVLLLAATSAIAQQYNVGGGAASPFLTDPCTGGTAYAAPATVIISTTHLAVGVTPPPQSVLTTERYGVSLKCVFTGFTPGALVNLTGWWAEDYWTKVGQRSFGMSSNGVPLFTNLDIIAAAGGPLIAYRQQFQVTADATGTITLTFQSGTADLPKIDGVELAMVPPPPPPVVTPTPAPAPTATVDAQGGLTLYMPPGSYLGFNGCFTSNPGNWFVFWCPQGVTVMVP